MENGKYFGEISYNAEPAVLPKLREWKGGIGTVKITEKSRIAIRHRDFRAEAEIVRDYIADILGSDIEIVTGDAVEVVLELPVKVGIVLPSCLIVAALPVTEVYHWLISL